MADHPQGNIEDVGLVLDRGRGGLENRGGRRGGGKEGRKEGRGGRSGGGGRRGGGKEGRKGGRRGEEGGVEGRKEGRREGREEGGERREEWRGGEEREAVFPYIVRHWKSHL